MSRWNEQFKSHPFQATWAALKTALDSAELVESSSVADFSELARLKKVVSYLSTVLDATDPELIPLGKWDEFNSQAAACSSEVLNYVSNRNIAHLHNANSYVDALLSTIKPFVVASGRSSRALSEAARDYSDVLTKLFEVYKKEASDALASIREARDGAASDAIKSSAALADVVADRVVVRGENGDGGILFEFRENLTSIVASHEKIAEVYDDLLVGSEEEDSKKSRFEAAVASVEERSEKIKGLVNRTVIPPQIS